MRTAAYLRTDSADVAAGGAPPPPAPRLGALPAPSPDAHQPYHEDSRVVRWALERAREDRIACSTRGPPHRPSWEARCHRESARGTPVRTD